MTDTYHSECGCLVNVQWGESGLVVLSYEVKRCPLHEAAGDMLKALGEISSDADYDNCNSCWRIRKITSLAIEKAKEKRA